MKDVYEKLQRALVTFDGFLNPRKSWAGNLHPPRCDDHPHPKSPSRFLMQELRELTFKLFQVIFAARCDISHSSPDIVFGRVDRRVVRSPMLWSASTLHFFDDSSKSLRFLLQLCNILLLAFDVTDEILQPDRQSPGGLNYG